LTDTATVEACSVDLHLRSTTTASRPTNLVVACLLSFIIMSGLQIPMSLTTQAASAAAITISTADFVKFLQAYEPRAGGANATGAWPGSGSGQLGTEPFSGYWLTPAMGPSGAAKHGLDNATNLKVIALIKEQEETLHTRLAIAALYEVDFRATNNFDVSLYSSKVVSATVAASIPGLDLSSGPVVDTNQFLCQPANYLG
jgi:hypothetical protein